jgi:hypothetical protein
MLWRKPFTASARPFQPKDVAAEDDGIENAVNIRLTSRQILPTAGKSCRGSETARPDSRNITARKVARCARRISNEPTPEGYRRRCTCVTCSVDENALDNLCE